MAQCAPRRESLRARPWQTYGKRIGLSLCLPLMLSCPANLISHTSNPPARHAVMPRSLRDRKQVSYKEPPLNTPVAPRSAPEEEEGDENSSAAVRWRGGLLQWRGSAHWPCITGKLNVYNESGY